jgi:hypothetical protein
MDLSPERCVQLSYHPLLQGSIVRDAQGGRLFQDDEMQYYGIYTTFRKSQYTNQLNWIYKIHYIQPREVSQQPL